MSQTLNAAIAVVGIDIGKNSFHALSRAPHRSVGPASVETRVSAPM